MTIDTDMACPYAGNCFPVQHGIGQEETALTLASVCLSNANPLMQGAITVKTAVTCPAVCTGNNGGTPEEPDVIVTIRQADDLAV